MVQAKVDRWDDALAVRIPAPVVEAVRLRDGERVDIAVRDGEVVIRRAETPPPLADLFKGRSAEAWRDEYATSYDWGPDIGREVLPE